LAVAALEGAASRKMRSVLTKPIFVSCARADDMTLMDKAAVKLMHIAFLITEFNSISAT
jgi:hypothetical protein